jgi:L,D-peptidoglycan transpeptidase YkuD (ErfK/YbiS/YcfS/YnhG family)
VNLLVAADGTARWGGAAIHCSLGRAGVARDKHEGDHATPAGSFAMRRVFYRPDREAPPATRLPLAALQPQDGWCDAPGDPAYNRLVRLPYPASAERLWREDRLYDLLVVLGWNDDPAVPGRGSAIFLHLRAPDGGSTEGCVALARGDLLAVLAAADAASRVIVRP